MLAEDCVVLDPNDVIHIVRVMLFQVTEDVQLYPCLVVETFFVPDYFNRDELIRLVIVAFESLTETAFAQEF